MVLKLQESGLLSGLFNLCFLISISPQLLEKVPFGKREFEGLEPAPISFLR